MNLAELQHKLVAAARRQPPDERVPYAFEKRVTALIQARTAERTADFWARGLWRATLPCLALTILCGAWVFYSPATRAANPADLSQSFENTLLASVDSSDWNDAAGATP